MLQRSFLFVPGNKTKMLDKALNSETDAIIIDLEDAVSLDSKDSARECLSNYFSNKRLTEKPLYLRINDINTEDWKDDIPLVNQLPLKGIILPKTNSSKDVQIVHSKLQKELEIIPLIESAKGLLSAFEIACEDTVSQLAFGAVDFCLEMGLPSMNNERELLYARSQLAVHSKAAGIKPPIDSVFRDIKDITGLHEETKASKKLGFGAKLLIHPNQIKTVNQCFEASEQEIHEAMEIVSAYEEALKNGSGVIDFNGKMIDYPVYKKAKEILKQ